MIPHHRRVLQRQWRGPLFSDGIRHAESEDAHQGTEDDASNSEEHGTGVNPRGQPPNYAESSSKAQTSGDTGGETNNSNEQGQNSNDESQSQPMETSGPATTRYTAPITTDYYPKTLSDVYTVMSLLTSYLPVELVLQVFDVAEYWVQENVYRNSQMSVWEGHSPKIYISTNPIQGPQFAAGPDNDQQGEEEHEEGKGEKQKEKSSETSPPHGPVKKIVFQLRSHDQGYSHDREYYGTYQHSWTWFTVSVTPCPSSPPAPGNDDEEEHGDPAPAIVPIRRRHLQTNVHASNRDTTHTITWSSDRTDSADRSDDDTATSSSSDGTAQQENRQVSGTAEEEREWVRALRPGDVVNVEIWAKYPSWVNHVGGVSVGVFFSGV